MYWDDFPEWVKQHISVILESLRERYPETYNHCRRVGKGTRLMARAIGLSENEQVIMEYAGLLHDIGKFQIPKGILHKPGKLSEEEYTMMKSHSEASVDMIEELGDLEFFKPVLDGILHHHERIDGQGYPYGLEKEAIPFESRLILIVDTYDAMTSDRAYRKGLPDEVAYKEIQKYAGSQFDEHLAKAFLESHKFTKKENQRFELEWEKSEKIKEKKAA